MEKSLFPNQSAPVERTTVGTRASSEEVAAVAAATPNGGVNASWFNFDPRRFGFGGDSIIR